MGTNNNGRCGKLHSGCSGRVISALSECDFLAALLPGDGLLGEVLETFEAHLTSLVLLSQLKMYIENSNFNGAVI